MKDVQHNTDNKIANHAYHVHYIYSLHVWVSVWWASERVTATVHRFIFQFNCTLACIAIHLSFARLQEVYCLWIELDGRWRRKKKRWEKKITRLERRDLMMIIMMAMATTMLTTINKQYNSTQYTRYEKNKIYRFALSSLSVSIHTFLELVI